VSLRGYVNPTWPGDLMIHQRGYALSDLPILGETYYADTVAWNQTSWDASAGIGFTRSR
jgi:hypothetical protein